jgi:putative PIN family toxin of toxin-antitoxin system
MLKVVYDTNIYISGIILSGTTNQLIEIARRKTFLLYISQPIIGELHEVMTNKFAVPPNIQQVVLRRVRSITHTTHPQQRVSKIPHQHPDNLILSTCLSCRADYLVTGDKKHLLPLKKYGKTKIVTPQEFIAILEP